jgi:hypothetical protein
MERLLVSSRPAHLQGSRPEHSPPPPRDAAGEQRPATILIASARIELRSYGLSSLSGLSGCALLCGTTRGMTPRRWLLTSCSLLWLCSAWTGCASQEPVAPPAPEPSAGGELPKTAAELEGSWVEFWALSGKADTQRYTFLADGRFGWQAAPGAADTPGRRFGRYEVQAGELVMRVQGEDARGDCTDAAPCRTFHDPAIELRMPLGACPDNSEASSLDQAYRCTAIGGQAFWRSNELRADSLAEMAK